MICDKNNTNKPEYCDYLFELIVSFFKWCVISVRNVGLVDTSEDGLRWVDNWFNLIPLQIDADIAELFCSNLCRLLLPYLDISKRGCLREYIVDYL